LGILFLPNHPTPEHPDCLILRMLKAIVFDYNGTLVDDLDLAVESYYRAGADRGYRLSRETVLQHISQPPSAKRGLYFGDVSDAEWAAIIERRKAIYADLARSVFKLFPQTETVLIALASRYRLGVLSNTFRDLFERLFPAHLAALFQASLFFDEVPDPKPSPAPMRAMLRTLGAATWVMRSKTCRWPGPPACARLRCPPGHAVQRSFVMPVPTGSARTWGPSSHAC
jgi:phosphoglycolate phosphatase-like HAD superfamily hydrolase